MMADKELLELAAKAAGLNIIDCGGLGLRIRSDGCKTGYMWNSLADDGDALRLLNDLNLNVFHVSGCAYAMPSNDDGEEQKVSYRDAGDKHAATRLAITRAAAEIGKAMP